MTGAQSATLPRPPRTLLSAGAGIICAIARSMALDGPPLSPRISSARPPFASPPAMAMISVLVTHCSSLGRCSRILTTRSKCLALSRDIDDIWNCVFAYPVRIGEI